MGLNRWLVKKYMTLFSNINRVDSQWEGYSLARNASTDKEEQDALLTIARCRYEESKEYPLDAYFKTDLKEVLQNKCVLEIGCNHGGATLAYFQLYGLKKIVGFDTSDKQAETGRMFFKNEGVPPDRYEFGTGYAEELPYPDNSFDVIITYDTFEHVADLSAVMKECYRVLRPKGMLMCIFPSYWHPTQHHLTDVTSAPCIHWFFSPQKLMEAYWEILDDNPVYRDYKGIERRPLHTWEKLWIINGTTMRKFRKIIAECSWSGISHVPVPIGTVGKVVSNNPSLKAVRFVSRILARLPFFEESANQRIVYILTK